MRIQGMINETVFKNERDFPLHKCFDAALNFLESNYKEKSWFLHLECFDPHEPFAAPERFRSASDFDFSGQEYTWPCVLLTRKIKIRRGSKAFWGGKRFVRIKTF